MSFPILYFSTPKVLSDLPPKQGHYKLQWLQLRSHIFSVVESIIGKHSYTTSYITSITEAQLPFPLLPFFIFPRLIYFHFFLKLWGHRQSRHLSFSSLPCPFLLNTTVYIKWDHHKFVFLLLAFFILHHFEFQLDECNKLHFTILCSCIVFYCVHIPHLIIHSSVVVYLCCVYILVTVLNEVVNNGVSIL